MNFIFILSSECLRKLNFLVISQTLQLFQVPQNKFLLQRPYSAKIFPRGFWIKLTVGQTAKPTNTIYMHASQEQDQPLWKKSSASSTLHLWVLVFLCNELPTQHQTVMLHRTLQCLWSLGGNTEKKNDKRTRGGIALQTRTRWIRLLGFPSPHVPHEPPLSSLLSVPCHLHLICCMSSAIPLLSTCLPKNLHWKSSF